MELHIYVYGANARKQNFPISLRAAISFGLWDLSGVMLRYTMMQ